MFKSTIRTDVLQSSIRAIVSLMEECRFDLTPDGLAARAVDAANASICSIDIPAQEFTQFDATECELGIDLTRFNEIIGMAKKDGDIELELDENTHKLVLRFDGFEYMMALLDTTTLRKSPLIPQLDLPAEITLSGAAFKRMTKAAAMMGSHMTMGVDGETFFMSAHGDSDKVRLDLTGDELISLKSADVASLFSLDYLIDMSKGIGTSNEVVIHLGRDLPLILDFDSSKDCSVIYILAPRIDGN